MHIMKITVKLFATLRHCIDESKKGTGILELPEKAKVRDVLEQLKIPRDIPKIILVNAKQKTDEEVLHEGDTLSVFPPIAGG